MKTGLGSGILAMPFLFKEFGVFNTITIMIFTGILCYLTWSGLSDTLD
jgi:amino acid permease